MAMKILGGFWCRCVETIKLEKDLLIGEWEDVGESEDVGVSNMEKSSDGHQASTYHSLQGHSSKRMPEHNTLTW